MPERDETRIRAVVLDLDDTLVTWQTLGHWQWSWKPNGPVLPERRIRSIMHRVQHRWDRERWHALAESSSPSPPPPIPEFVAATLEEIAGHPLPVEETQAVVRRFLSSATGVELFPDARILLTHLSAGERPWHVATYLPKAVAEGALRRAGVPADRLVSWGDNLELAPLPSRAGFRGIVARVGGPARSILYVGDLFWSDYRAASRSGLTAVWLDRDNLGERTGATRVRALPEVEKWLDAPPAVAASAADEVPPPAPQADG